MGKNSSGSSSRQAATWRQSDMTATLLASRIYQIISMHLAVPIADWRFWASGSA
jgi:hypothetical protein